MSGGHGHVETSNKKIALLVAILAALLAVSEMGGKSAQTNGLSSHIDASNLWSFFQAKTIRQTVLQAATEILKIDLTRDGGDPAATKAALSKRIQSWEAIAARYDTELMDPPVRKEVNTNPPYGEGRRELMARAIAAEAKRDTSLEKYHHYEVASAAFQIGIVLASATVITGMLVLSYISVGLACLGLGFMAIGLFAPHAVHLF
jgi:hypothetical protein